MEVVAIPSDSAPNFRNIDGLAFGMIWFQTDGRENSLPKRGNPPRRKVGIMKTCRPIFMDDFPFLHLFYSTGVPSIFFK